MFRLVFAQLQLHKRYTVYCKYKHVNMKIYTIHGSYRMDGMICVEPIIFSSESLMFNQKHTKKKGQTFEQKLQQQSIVSLVAG